MDHKLSIHVRNFNDRIRVMNQTQSATLVMTAQDARNLHADIFALLSHITELSERPDVTTGAVEITMDGGGF